MSQARRFQRLFALRQLHIMYSLMFTRAQLFAARSDLNLLILSQSRGRAMWALPLA
jgi:hypothetical protein